MNKLYDDVQRRLDYVYGENKEEPQKEVEIKGFTLRLSVDLIEQLDNIATILQMNRTEVARMILTRGVEGIVKEFKITTGEHKGATFGEIYDYENASLEERKEMLDKWQQEAEERKKGGEVIE